jgi:hypothetical protein
MWGKSSASGCIKGEIRKWRRKGTEAFDFFNFSKLPSLSSILWKVASQTQSLPKDRFLAVQSLN